MLLRPKTRIQRYILGSAVFHLFLLGVAIFQSMDLGLQPRPTSLVIDLTEGSRGHRNQRNHIPQNGDAGVDLRPLFVKQGLVFGQKQPQIAGVSQAAQTQTGVEGIYGDSAITSKGYLHTEGKVFAVFDLLATKINKNLDFPEMLSEAGLQGVAGVDLYFDHKGEVDESKSHFSGSGRILRGLVVKAVRRGLEEWYLSDSVRLEKDKFRNQHFHTSFDLSYLLKDESSYKRVAPNSYSFLRRKFINNCILPMAPGAVILDLGCAGKRVAGMIKRKTSSLYLGQYAAMVENLESYDALGFAGINERVHSKI